MLSRDPATQTVLATVLLSNITVNVSMGVPATLSARKAPVSIVTRPATTLRAVTALGLM